MPNIEKINFQVTDELVALRQRVAELEQSEIFYQQRQAALEEQVIELEKKLALALEYPHIQAVEYNIKRHLEQKTSTALNVPTDVAVTLEQLQQEIAQRQQVEACLKESEERLRLALEVSQMGLWDWNIITNQVIWSENYELLFGVLPGSFDGPYETFQKCVYPEDRQSVMQKIAHALAQKSDYNDEFRIVRSDQNVHWIYAKGKFIYDDRGQAVRMIGVCMETTVCKQAVESTRELTTQVQEQANILNAILTASVDHIYIFDHKGCYQFVSHDGATILGFKPQDIVGKTLQDLDVPADLIEQVDNQRQAVMKTGQPIKDECKYVTADGVHYYEYILTPLRNCNQSIEGVITVSRDITEHKRAEKSLRESEARFRRLFESNLIGVAFWNVDGFIVDANDAFLQLAGYTRDDATLARINWRELTPVEYKYLDDRALLEVETTGVSRIYEKEYLQPNGKRVSIVLGIALLNDSKDNGVAFVLDITDRKSVEKERDRLLKREMKARQEAEIANKVKDEFLGVLSHELRTPLNSVLGWSKLLRTRNFDQKTTNHALETIERNAKLQTQLIEDLLDVSRILQGKLNLNICPVNLVMVVEAALETVQLAAQAKSIQIQTIFDPTLGQVMGDSNRLVQVVWNLLSNAVKFTPAGGRVEIRLMEVGNQAQIQVSDTGKGINPEFLPYVFDYFRQADSTITRAFGGLGLGLAIVRKVVEMHEGLAVCIYRPGFISGHRQTGIANLNDTFYRFIGGCIEMGMYPDFPEKYWNAIPVDYVAAVIAHISSDAKYIGGNYNIVVPREQELSNVEIFEYLSELGYHLQKISPKNWLNALSTLSTTNPLYPLISFLQEKVYQNRSTILEVHHRTPICQVNNTLNSIQGSGILCPKIDEKLIRQYLPNFDKNFSTNQETFLINSVPKR